MKKNALLLAGLCAFGLFTWPAEAKTVEGCSMINSVINILIVKLNNFVK